MTSCDLPGHEFLAKLEQAEDDIRKSVERISGYVDLLPEEDAEELRGKIDLTVGCGNLLLKGKCNQFRQLCLKNIDENPSDQFPTTRADLEGFWDLVSITIENVTGSFATMDRLKENGWKEEEQNNSLKKKQPLINKNENVREENKAQQEARRRLVEFKKAARQRQLAEEAGEVIN